MKNLLKSLLLICLVLLAVSLVLVSCDNDEDDNVPPTENSGETDDKTDDGEEEHTHTPGEWIIDKEASCTENGSKHRACAECGEGLESAEIVAGGHSYDSVRVVEPTASSEGYTEHTCVCGESYKDNILPPVLVESKGFLYEVNDDGVTCTITKYGSCNDAVMVIPRSIDGYTVTCIGNNAFIGRNNITKLVIPDTVTRIDYSAFMSCTALNDITLPDSIEYIGTDAFKNCGYYKEKSNWEDGALYISNHLIKVNLPLGDYTLNIKEGIITIAERACEDAYVKTVTMPDSVKYICSRAFQGCEVLKDLTMSKSVVKIYSSAFEYCTDLHVLTLPETLVYVGYGAFGGCSDLKTISLPDSLEYIGMNAFSGTYYYKKDANWGEDGLLYIGNHLVGVKSTASGAITVKEGTIVIEAGIFSQRNQITEIIIPDSVKSIEYQTFARVESLKSITLGKGIKYIASFVFSNCENLESITYDGTKEQWEAISKDEDWDKNTPSFTIHCTNGDIVGGQ